MVRIYRVLVIFVLVLLPRQLVAVEAGDVLNEARRLRRSGDHARVAELLQQEIFSEPEAVDPIVRIQALEMIGVSYELAEENERAADAFMQRWLELVAVEGSDSLSAVVESARVANVLTRAGKFERSRMFWNLHLATAARGRFSDSIDEADAFYGIARSYARERNYERAELWFRKALSEAPEPTMQRSVILIEFADLLAQEARTAEAEGLRNEASKIRARLVPVETK